MTTRRFGEGLTKVTRTLDCEILGSIMLADFMKRGDGVVGPAIVAVCFINIWPILFITIFSSPPFGNTFANPSKMKRVVKG